MVEMVEARKNSDKVEQRYDLFSGLLDAAQDEQDSQGALALGDDELIGGYSTPRSFGTLESVLPVCLGNMFIFLIAGHEVGSSPSSCGIA